MANDSIKQLKQKYRLKGYDALTQNEKVRLFLSYAEKECDVDKAVSNLLGTFSSLHTAVNSDSLFLMNICKMSLSSTVLLGLVPILSDMYSSGNCSNMKLNSSENAKKFFSTLLKNSRFEKSIIIAMNSRFSIIGQLVFTDEEMDKISISLHKLYEFSNDDDIKYIIISHCHPNGSAVPSQNDINATVQINNFLRLTDIILVDHIIISSEDEISMREYMKEDIFDYVEGYITTDE